MIYLTLFWEFLKIGLFAVGGGMATLPFLKELGARTGWFRAAMRRAGRARSRSKWSWSGGA